MLRGELTGLRAQLDSDIEVFETELLTDVETWVRSDNRPWRPVAPGSADSPYRGPAGAGGHGEDVKFSVVELATGSLAGEAIVWAIDLHNRSAHLGLSLLPAFRGKHLGTDVVRVLCRYGFGVRGLHRLQIETLTDNHAMIGAAIRAGFVAEGTLRGTAWVDGIFMDEVILGQLAAEWQPAKGASGCVPARLSRSIALGGRPVSTASPGGHMDRRRFLAGTGLFVAGGAAGTVGAFAAEPAIAAEGPTARTAVPGGPGTFAATVTFRTTPSARLVALTIDDGPTREWTPQLLAILRRHDARATFFRVGKRAQAARDLVAQTADAGHEQGNHTWTHDDLTQHDEGFDRVTLERTHEFLTAATGRAPVLCRPPYGRIDSVGLAVCAGLGYAVTLWSNHVTGSNPRGDVDAILHRASPGSILLAHDGGPEPNANLMTQLDRLVASMTDAGYRFVTVSDLLAARA